ncbi:hypothetical protein, conserved [Eimeria praecox]|uniref:Uncharacterized protein n=1 Tax=Eimeria praecox TaxID=51316 RepID=U6H6C2_9EIME|nr:hypothetical protein, conserved [Eimeria praecox]
MDRLWAWLLVVAAVEVAGGLAGGSIGLAETTMESETTNSTHERDSPIPSRVEELSVLDGHLAFMRGDTETEVSGDDDVTKASLSFPCSTCTSAVEEADPGQAEREGSLEEMRTTPGELLVKETSPVAAAAPLRGIKTLIVGSLIVGLLLLILSGPEEVHEEDGAFAVWRHFIAEEMIEGMFVTDELLDTKFPVFPFKVFSFWMLAGVGPMLITSGLVKIARSLKLRRQGRALPKGRRVSLRPVNVIATILSLWAMMLPAYRNTDNSGSQLLEDISVNIAWGANIAYLSLLLL